MAWICKECGSEVVLAEEVIETKFKSITKNKKYFKSETFRRIAQPTDCWSYICTNDDCCNIWNTEKNNCYELEDIAVWKPTRRNNGRKKNKRIFKN